MSKQVQQDVGFDRVLSYLKAYCHCEATREKIDQSSFFVDHGALMKALTLVREYVDLLSLDVRPVLVDFVAIDQHLTDLQPENSVLDLQSIVDFKPIFQNYQQWRNIWKSEDALSALPNLRKWCGDLPKIDHLVGAIERIVDEEGRVRDDASEGLIAIRKKQRKILSQISGAFLQALKKYSDFLIPSRESYKNGRRVLAVKSEHKRNIAGLMHDESSSGKTSFIEPEEVIVLNHQLFETEVEERKEIYKIIQKLCSTLREDIPLIQWTYQLCVDIDLLQAKAGLAQRWNGILPTVHDHPQLGWEQAVHPLLWEKNRAEHKAVIPSDFTLLGKNRLLLISGPNAGGKSVALKTCAILQMMLQYGLLIPCGEQSKVGIFKSMMVDIGDHQSIDNDLSTYSSFLLNMKEMIERVDDQSLVCIDEFGSGTDPTTGGALAEAILHEFLQKKCFGIITTHYSNLKVYAFKQSGIVNAAMQFDTQTLSPTYQLNIGKPGSSFAFEIAQKMKLPSRVIQRARQRLGDKKVKVEDLLVSIQAEKVQLEKELDRLQNKEKDLDRLISTYNTLQGQLDYKRKKLKLEIKEKHLSLESDFNRKLENTIRDIKEKENLAEAKKVAKEKKKSREILASEVRHLQNDVISYEQTGAEDLSGGDAVKMRNGDVIGEVEMTKGDQITVIFGGMRMVVPRRDLRKVKPPIATGKGKGVYTELHQRSSQFKSKIDIRGLKMEDAYDIVQSFLDEAIVVGVKRLEILHGKGSGVLRNIVKEKAREYAQISRITHPDPEYGGEGISVIWLDA